MSGGKDSAVIFELAKLVAAELGRLPLKCFWLDQEAEWLATEDYMRGVMHAPEVRPYWFQIPFRLTNALSSQPRQCSSSRSAKLQNNPLRACAEVTGNLYFQTLSSVLSLNDCPIL
jgi:predicted phosphoadenosine phosphosulfate sulfurtransferase